MGLTHGILCNFHDIKNSSHVGMTVFKISQQFWWFPSGQVAEETSSGFQDVRSLFRPEMFLKQTRGSCHDSPPPMSGHLSYTKGILLLETWQSIFHLQCRNMKWIHIIYCNPLTQVYTVYTASSSVLLIFYKHNWLFTHCMYSLLILIFILDTRF